MDESCDVVIVGAGLAGLSCARDLHRSGLDVVVLEAQDGVGGRVRTDRVDGLLLDRGFQLLNPSYPRAIADLDLDALDLQCFDAGVMVARGDGRRVLADPRRSPRDLWSTVTTGLGTLPQRLRLAAWLLRVGYGPARRLKTAPDRSLQDEFRHRGIDGELVEAVLRPFLSGTLADAELATSTRFAQLIVRSFVRGTPGVPAAGMQAIPEQLAASLGPTRVQLDHPVDAVRSSGSDVTVTGPWGSVTGRCAVVAAGPVTSARLLDHAPTRMRGLTTTYYLAAESPATRTLLHLDGDRRGPVVNAAVMSDAAPSYAPGRVLVAATVLGADGGVTDDEVRRHLGVIYGHPATRWEHVTTYAIADALPDTPPGTGLRRSVRAGERIFQCGDHRDTASIQGALVSGHRAAAAVRAELG